MLGIPPSCWFWYIVIGVGAYGFSLSKQEKINLVGELVVFIITVPLWPIWIGYYLGKSGPR